MLEDKKKMVDMISDSFDVKISRFVFFSITKQEWHYKLGIELATYRLIAQYSTPVLIQSSYM